MSYNQLFTHPSTHVERERKKHMMSRLQSHQQPHQERVGALPQSHPGLCGTPVGPGKDTHATPVPQTGKAVGGQTQPPRRRPTTNDHKTQASVKTNVLSATSADTHLETYRKNHRRYSRWENSERKPVIRMNGIQVSHHISSRMGEHRM